MSSYGTDAHCEKVTSNEIHARTRLNTQTVSIGNRWVIFGLLVEILRQKTMACLFLIMARGSLLLKEMLHKYLHL